jgi:hypothetical protein
MGVIVVYRLREGSRRTRLISLAHAEPDGLCVLDLSVTGDCSVSRLASGRFFSRTQERAISHVVRQPVECPTVTVVMEERPSRTTRPTLLRMKAVVMQKTAIGVVARWQFSS